MNPNRASFASEGTYTPDGLIVDGKDIRAKVVTLVSGQNVVRGTVLGTITASGKVATSLAASSNGSETPDVIAAEDVDASGGDKDIVVYYTGDFDSAALTIGTGHTAASIKEGLRAKGIFLHTSVPA